MSKVMSAQEAISLIKDGDKIGVGGFIGMGHPQELSVAIENSFLEPARPVSESPGRSLHGFVP